MKRCRCILAALLSALVVAALVSCSQAPKPPAIRVLIVPKFEVGTLADDFPGEAQLFYEAYCDGCEETAVPHMPPDARFYFNEENGVAILVTGSGKIASSLSLTSLFSSGLYDCSDTYIVTVGCAGGNMEAYTLGDVVIGTAVCDYDLGHRVDSAELSSDDATVTWFHDAAYDANAYRLYNAELVDTAYHLTKDVPLRTTENALKVLVEEFPTNPRATSDPAVVKGTLVTSDSFWKGQYGHDNAVHLVEYYGCPDPYAVTEMEDVAVALTAESYGMMDRLISLRVIANTDVFHSGDTPESLWGDGVDLNYNADLDTNNSDTLDIFVPAMHNLYDVGSTVVDAILAGELK